MLKFKPYTHSHKHSRFSYRILIDISTRHIQSFVIVTLETCDLECGLTLQYIKQYIKESINWYIDV